MKKQISFKVIRQIKQFLFELANTDQKETKVHICEQMFDYIILDNYWLLNYPTFKMMVEKKLKELKNENLWTKSNFYLCEIQNLHK